MCKEEDDVNEGWAWVVGCIKKKKRTKEKERMGYFGGKKQKMANLEGGESDKKRGKR